MTENKHFTAKLTKNRTRVHFLNYYYYYNNNRFTALCPGLLGWSGTTRNVHPLTYPDHQPSFINFFHLLRSIAFSLYNLRSWQSFLHNLSPSPLGLELSTSYSIQFLTQSVSSFHNKCPYHCNLFCCNTKTISSIPSIFLNLYLELYLP